MVAHGSNPEESGIQRPLLKRGIDQDLQFFVKGDRVRGSPGSARRPARIGIRARWRMRSVLSALG